jgi:hypothetical protein
VPVSSEEPSGVEAHGIRLFAVEDDGAPRSSACLVLASLESDDVVGDEPGQAEDDEELDDPADDEDVPADV